MCCAWLTCLLCLLSSFCFLLCLIPDGIPYPRSGAEQTGNGTCCLRGLFSQDAPEQYPANDWLFPQALWVLINGYFLHWFLCWKYIQFTCSLTDQSGDSDVTIDRTAAVWLQISGFIQVWLSVSQIVQCLCLSDRSDWNLLILASSSRIGLDVGDREGIWNKMYYYTSTGGKLDT